MPRLVHTDTPESTSAVLAALHSAHATATRKRAARVVVRTIPRANVNDVLAVADANPTLISRTGQMLGLTAAGLTRVRRDPTPRHLEA